MLMVCEGEVGDRPHVLLPINRLHCHSEAIAFFVLFYPLHDLSKYSVLSVFFADLTYVFYIEVKAKLNPTIPIPNLPYKYGSSDKICDVEVNYKSVTITMLCYSYVCISTRIYRYIYCNLYYNRALYP